MTTLFHPANPRHLAGAGCFLALVLLGTARPAWAGPIVTYGVDLSGYAWGNEVSSTFQMDDTFRLSDEKASVAGKLLQAEAGDLSANWDSLGLAGRSFEGIKLGVPVGQFETTFFGGNVTMENELGVIASSPIYGMRTALPLKDGFQLSAAEMLAPGAARGDQSISTLDLDFAPSLHRSLSLELARSSGGVAWQLSGAEKTRQMDLRASFREAATGFSAAGNPALLTQRSGGYADFHYKLSHPLTVGLTSQNYGDGSGGVSRYGGLELLYAGHRGPAFNVFMRSEVDRTSPQAALLLGNEVVPDSAAHTVGFGVSEALGANYLSFQYDRLNYSETGFAANQLTNRISLGLSRPIGPNTSLALRHIMLSGDSSNGGQGPQTYSSADIFRRIGRKGLSLGLGVDRQQNLQPGATGLGLAGRMTLLLPLGNGNSLGVQYRHGLSAAGSVSGIGRDVMYLTYSRSIKIGPAPPPSQAGFLGADAQTRRLYGKITGRVFEDVNGNGKWDPGEPGVPDVAMTLGQGLDATTDADGVFTIPELYPGSYQVHLGLDSLPIEFAVLEPTDVNLNVPAGKTVTLDFPVQRTGQISGTAFMDTNRNGVQDPGEPGLKDAVIRVAGSDILTFTDDQGHFTLTGLPPKSWTISVDTDAMAQGTTEYEPSLPAPCVVLVTPNGTTAGILLGVAPKARAIVFEQIGPAPPKP